MSNVELLTQVLFKASEHIRSLAFVLPLPYRATESVQSVEMTHQHQSDVAVGQESQAEIDKLLSVIDQSHENIFGKSRTTLKERFGDASGRVLWLVFMKHYILGRFKYRYYAPRAAGGDKEKRTAADRLLTRAMLVNDRRQERTIERYKPGMRHRGFNPEHRSTAVVIDFLGLKIHPDARELLGAAHCVESLCECQEEDDVAGVENPQIKASIADGLWAYEVHSDTPPECQLEIVDMLNINIDASGLDIGQIFQKYDRTQRPFLNS